MRFRYLPPFQYPSKMAIVLHMVIRFWSSQILKSVALTFDPKPNKIGNGFQDLELLLDRKQPVVDPDALALLESFSQSIIHSPALLPKLERIWERAAVGLTSNHAWIFKTWFKAKFFNGLYSGAKQVCGPTWFEICSYPTSSFLVFGSSFSHRAQRSEDYLVPPESLSFEFTVCKAGIDLFRKAEHDWLWWTE